MKKNLPAKLKPEKKKKQFVTVVTWASEADFLDAKVKAQAENMSVSKWLLTGRGYLSRSVGPPRGSRNNSKGRPSKNK